MRKLPAPRQKVEVMKWRISWLEEGPLGGVREREFTKEPSALRFKKRMEDEGAKNVEITIIH